MEPVDFMSHYGIVQLRKGSLATVGIDSERDSSYKALNKPILPFARSL